MQRGGARPGAGRKRKAVRVEKARHAAPDSPIQQAESKIRDNLPWLVDKLFELAEGVYEEKPMGDGIVIVYKNRPDRKSCEYLINRALGMPTQPVSIVDTVRALAAQEGYSDEETAAAVAEAERLMKVPALARG